MKMVNLSLKQNQKCDFGKKSCFPASNFLDITDNIFISFFIAPGSAKSTRCYGRYGCYSNKAPFNRIVLLPLPPWVVNPKFRLYTRLHPDTPQFIDDNDVTKLQQSNYNGTKKTVLIVHGYVGELTIVKRMIECFYVALGNCIFCQLNRE